MLQIFIAALLSLGIITSSDQATQDLIDQNQTEINEYIISTDIDTI